MSNSTHVAEVVELKLRKLENSDTLSICDVFGYTCVVKTSDWQGLTKAAYIPPDNMVPVKLTEFEWLKDKANSEGMYRVKAMKLRGQLSFGLLVPIDDKFNIGDDVTKELEIEHYVPRTTKGSGNKHVNLLAGCENVTSPSGVFAPKYDLEAFRRYGKDMFKDGENVIVTCKLHGQNSRYCYKDGEMFCGSRTIWKAEFPQYKNITIDYLIGKGCTEDKAKEIYEGLQSKVPQKNTWWRALENTKGLRAFCENFPGYVVYGEIYGSVQDLNYDCKPGEIRFAAFDIRDNEGKWLDWGVARFLLNMYSIPCVPLFNELNSFNQEIIGIPFDFDKICAMAEGKSLIASHVREGVVIRSYKESVSDKGFRRVLKCVGEGYYSRKGIQETLVDEDE